MFGWFENATTETQPAKSELGNISDVLVTFHSLYIISLYIAHSEQGVTNIWIFKYFPTQIFVWFFKRIYSGIHLYNFLYEYIPSYLFVVKNISICIKILYLSQPDSELKGCKMPPCQPYYRRVPCNQPIATINISTRAVTTHKCLGCSILRLHLLAGDHPDYILCLYAQMLMPGVCRDARLESSIVTLA